jgi:hypothetical protein
VLVSHAVASHAVTPTDIEAVLPLSPDTIPFTIILADPVLALFLWQDELRSDDSHDTRLLTELIIEAVVSSAVLLTWAPSACERHRTDESAAHIVP